MPKGGWNRINSIEDVKRATARCGRHFFEKATMRFFKSRIGANVYKSRCGVYFTTSEQGPNGRRAYSVRRFGGKGGCNIDTVGEFQQYKTSTSANAAAKRAADKCPRVK